MAWYWSDDVARAAIDAGLISQSAVHDWLHRPVAFAADEDRDLADLASALLGIDQSETAGAA